MKAMLREIREFDPTIDEEHASALAYVWNLELDKILTIVVAVGTREEGLVSTAVRDELIVHFAKLTSWLAHGIVRSKTKTTTLHEIDPVAELAAIATQDVEDCIRNTADIVAEKIWIKTIRRLRSRHPPNLVVTSETAERPPSKVVCGRLAKPRPTKRNHYLPQFYTRTWADSDGNVTLHKKNFNGSVVSLKKGHTVWAHEQFLYSQYLEEYFSAIESDASHVFRKLIAGEQLNRDESNSWMTFLLVQYLRTPAFIEVQAAALRTVIKAQGIDYDTNPASLSLAYETLFSNDELHHLFLSTVDKMQWNVFSSAPGESFVTCDVPLIRLGPLTDPDAGFVFPLTPKHVFLAIRTRQQPADKWPVKTQFRDLPKGGARNVNLLLVINAKSSVISRTEDSTKELRELLEEVLEEQDVRRTIDQWWGSLI